MSACDTGNRHFANAIAKTNKGMYSIVAPQGSVKINVATAAWAALYVKLHTIDEDRMVARDIKKTLKALSSLLGLVFLFQCIMQTRISGRTHALRIANVLIEQGSEIPAITRRKLIQNLGLVLGGSTLWGSACEAGMDTQPDLPLRPPLPAALVPARSSSSSIRAESISRKRCSKEFWGTSNSISSRGRTLSHVSLSNADEPAMVFRVVRGDRPPHGTQSVGKPPA